MSDLISYQASAKEKNFSMNIIYRILSELSKKGASKITPLAMSTHLNHNTCKKYVDLLLVVDWIELSFEKKHLIIKINNNGREIFEKMHKVINKNQNQFE